MSDPTSPGRVVTLSVTATGAALAERLPFPHRHGDIAAQVAALWDHVDGLVLVCASGIAVRVVGPLLADKQRDPAVVCVDDQGRWAIALAGGHHGANTLARQVAALVGAEPVVTTATDGAGLPGLDTLSRYTAEGDIPTVTRAWLDGTPPTLTVDREALPHWPTPAALDSLEPAGTSMSARSARSAGPPPTGASLPLLPTASAGAGVAPGLTGMAMSAEPTAPAGRHQPAPPARTARRTGPDEATAATTPTGPTRPREAEPAVVPGSAGSQGSGAWARPVVPAAPPVAGGRESAGETSWSARKPRSADPAASAGPGEPATPEGPTVRTGPPGSVTGVGPARSAEPRDAASACSAGPTEVENRRGRVHELEPSMREWRRSPGPTVVISDRVLGDESEPGLVVLRPESLVVGVGSSSGADPEGIAQLVDGALRDARLSPASVGLVASVDLKQDEPGIVALAERFGVRLRTAPASQLAAIAVPNPSPVVAAAVGTPSVAEAAALAAAGPDAELVVTKRASTEATVAVARRARPEGKLAVVGLGPGTPQWRTPAAGVAIQGAEVVIGYGPYVDLAADLLAPHHVVVRSPIGAEAERCAEALDRASQGQRVALVCSGDPGVFAMASLVCELAPDHGNPPVTVVPGVTAALGAAALLGAPLGHDHAAVSLSDLLTPWAVIEQRVQAVAEGDLAVSFYNPRSQRRSWQLGRAVEILATHRPPDCPVAVVADVGRPDQRLIRTTLDAFDEHAQSAVDMLSLVVVGSSTTRWIGDRMVTPRGYTVSPDEAPARSVPV